MYSNKLWILFGAYESGIASPEALKKRPKREIGGRNKPRKTA